MRLRYAQFKDDNSCNAFRPRSPSGLSRDAHVTFRASLLFGHRCCRRGSVGKWVREWRKPRGWAVPGFLLRAENLLHPVEWSEQRS